MAHSTGTQRAKASEIERKPKTDGNAVHVHTRIAERAYRLYEERGSEPGREIEDWLRAEEEILNEQTDLR
jgi:hypothetical protein